MIKIIIDTFLIVGFISAAIASARWGRKGWGWINENLEYKFPCFYTLFLVL